MYNVKSEVARALFDRPSSSARQMAGEGSAGHPSVALSASSLSLQQRLQHIASYSQCFYISTAELKKQRLLLSS
jgi:hypothetical protein